MTAAGESAPSSGAPLSLEAGPPVSRARGTRSGYLHPLTDGSDYERIYSRKIRAIKGWLAAGRAVHPSPDMPPLDDPVAMIEWWGRVMTNDPPACLLAARADELQRRTPAASAAPTAAAGRPPGAAPAPPSENNSPRAAITDFTTVEGLDLPAAIERLQQVLAVVQRDYESALCDPATADSILTMRAGRVDKCLERLHQLEKTLTESRRKNGDLIARTDLRDEASPLLESMAGSLVSELSDRFGIERARATLFADAWFRRLRESRFLTESVPSLTPTTAAA